MLTKQKVLLVKEESSYGVDASCAGTNAVDARNVVVNYVGEVLERDYVRGNLSPVAPVLGKRHIEISFECDIKGSGSNGVAPEIGDLLEACGFTETIGGASGSSIIYTPNSLLDSTKSVTIQVENITSAASCRVDLATGCRGTVEIDFSASQIAKARFTMRGLYNIPTDAAITTPSYDSTIPPICQSSAFTFNSEGSLVVQQVSLDVANEITPQDDLDASAGLKGFLITGRKPKGSFNPEAVTVATYDFWTDWVNATERALTLNLGSTNYNKLAVSCPKCTIDALSEADRNGIKVDEVPFSLAGNSGNDEISLTFS